LQGRCRIELRQIADLALKRKLKQNNRFGYSVFAGMSGIISLTLHSRAVGKHMRKMTVYKITYLILILFVFISCENNSATDEKILSDIFPQLIDSLWISKTNLIPPPPPPIYDKDSNFIGIDSLAAKRILNKQKQLISKIDSIDPRLLIGLVDTNYSIDFKDLFRRTYSDSLLIRQIISDNESKDFKGQEWNINLIHTPNNYQLILKSDLETTYSYLWKIGDRKFAGLIAVSQIYLVNDNKTGLLQFESYPFKQEGESYFVVVELIDNKWRIKRILMNWIT
jgi:hypothetical protein